MLVTDSADLAKAVQAELEVQIPQLPRAAIARASVDDNGKIIVCTDLHKAIEACNIIAPEHLEAVRGGPLRRAERDQKRGQHLPGPQRARRRWAITSPAPTTPCPPAARPASPARWAWTTSSRSPAFIYYTREALGEVAPRIADFAEREGLHAHAKSVTIRYEK